MSQSYDDSLFTVFVKTGIEGKTMRFLNSFLNESKVKAFVPIGERFFRKSGETYLKPYVVFPGYIFLEAPFSDNSFLNRIYKCCHASDNMFHLLKYDNSFDVAMNEGERRVLESLWDSSNHSIRASKGYIKGKDLVVTDGPLMGMEREIKWINRHKRVAKMDVSLFGEKREISLGLEVVEKLP
jgi:transcriptional antiterminator NusG